MKNGPATSNYYNEQAMRGARGKRSLEKGEGWRTYSDEDGVDKMGGSDVTPPKLALAEFLAITLDKPTCDSMGNRPSSIIRVNA